MSNTQEKLDEARFFLDKLKDNRSILPDFTYYLNAFISSARSVAWVMRAEFSKVQGWEEWFKSASVNDDEKTLLSGFNEARIHSQKVAPLKPVLVVQIEFEINDYEEYEKREGRITEGSEVKIFPKIENRDADEFVRSGSFLFGKTAGFNYEIEQLRNHDIIEASNKYMQSLERLVKDCHDKFTYNNVINSQP